MISIAAWMGPMEALPPIGDQTRSLLRRSCCLDSLLRPPHETSSDVQKILGNVSFEKNFLLLQLT